MKFVLATCPKTSHIIEVQRYLFGFYKWDFGNPLYINNPGVKEDWCKNMYEVIKDLKDDIILFGLDDFLPIDYPDHNYIRDAIKIIENDNICRVELGWGASNNKYRSEQMQVISNGTVYRLYKPSHPYKVSTQFSVWKRESLLRVLKDVDSSPWKFETKGICNAACMTSPALMYINESALSERQKGKVNVLGLRPEVVNELVRHGLLNRKKLIYGWKGNTTFSPELAGKQYQKYYE